MELWLLDLDDCAVKKVASLGMQNRCFSYSLERIVWCFIGIFQTMQVPKVIFKTANALRTDKLPKQMLSIGELLCYLSIYFGVLAPD